MADHIVQFGITYITIAFFTPRVFSFSLPYWPLYFQATCLGNSTHHHPYKRRRVDRRSKIEATIIAS